MSKLTKALTAAAGNAGESLYVEDVFSTYLYAGTGSAQTITNGIDLAGEGGLVWMKARNNFGAYGRNVLMDTERVNGSNDYILYTDGTDAQAVGTADLTTYNSDGFTINAGYSGWNGYGYNYASWTFRKAEKFFDVVTYTGTGSNQAVSHNLGSTPAVIIVKRTDASGFGWFVWHKDFSTYQYIALNLADALQTNSSFPLFVTQNDSSFTVGTNGGTNASGGSYVAYLFASDAGGFGDDGSESIIKCGSYTGNGATGQEINLGFEPQWVMIKNASSGSWDGWHIYDNMRGLTVGGLPPYLRANLSNAEQADSANMEITSTGLKLGDNNYVNYPPDTYIYIAIRRPMKTPESGTEVFSPVTFTGDGVSGRVIDAGFSVDTSFGLSRSTTFDNSVLDRIRGNDKFLYTVQTIAESTKARWAFDEQNGIRATTIGADGNNNGDSRIHYFFKRATGFFDVVAYTGTGSTAAYQSNLGVPVEFVIVKRRDSAGDWYCWHTSFGQSLVPNIKLNSNAAKSSATLAVWLANPNLANYFWVTGLGNTSGADYISYHFATLDGVSKVGSYTGTGSNVNVDCGFSAGARFILIKRTDSTGDWYVWDSVRGIVAGNDPYLLLNSTAAEVTSTDYIDPLASGFTVTSSAPAALNASGGTYIFLAIS